ncbi:hypothetical protein SDC9_96649 [bioreactor metagenome]|uniref:Uncharacterized protein n=1 Tax=bioreactor metagenome TaxID=1076179 RepID=A0A645A9M8_9ZZZZ
MMASAQVAAARMKEKITAGPAKLPAARAPTEKIPAPTATARPRIIRSKTPSVRWSCRPGSSESASACSMVFVFSHCMHIPGLLATLLARRLRPGPFGQKGILGISPMTRRFPAASPVYLHVLCRPGCTPISKQTSQARASRSLRRAQKSRCSPACKRALTQDSKKARGRAILPDSDARRLRRHIGRANQQAEHRHQHQRRDHIQHMVLMHQHG